MAAQHSLRPADASRVLRDAGPTMSVPEAGVVLGITRATAYSLAAAGNFPVRVLAVGRQLRVPTADVRAAVGLPVEQGVPA